MDRVQRCIYLATSILRRCQGSETQLRHLSNNTARITKIHREIFVRTYPVRVIQPDGSSYTIRYHTPRQVIREPVDVSLLTEEEKQALLQRRKPRKKVDYIPEEKRTYSASKYVNLVKKK